jgi:hypothetical protein
MHEHWWQLAFENRMLRLTVILIFGLQSLGLGQSLTGQVFILADDFSDDKCEAFGECDCCTSDIFFISADRFCYISRCISGDSYFSGTYSVKLNKLRLTFDKKSVNEITDDEYSVTRLETKATSIDAAEFEILKCGQRTRLTHATEREWSNGSRYPQKEEAPMIKALLASKPWKQLSK